MPKCEYCVKEIDEDADSVRATIRGKAYYFCGESCLSDFLSKRNHVQKNLLSVVLSKTFFELVAIGTGISGVVYTLQKVSSRALAMDTLSAIAAMAAFIIGVESLRLLKTYSLLKRGLLLAALGIIISIVIPTLYFELLS